uniref:Uncharacterized protein n=1 Tax=Leersia perrieri TaxID=77586 RepID=A0A0D9V314_9ORYZ
MSRKQQGAERGEDGKEVWDMGSSLYDSYELASLCQILDRHINPDLPSPHGEPTQQEELAEAASPPEERKCGQVVVFRGAHRHRGRPGTGRKMTLRSLFRAAACWAIRPRKAHGCGCVAASSGAIEPVVTPGKL